MLDKGCQDQKQWRVEKLIKKKNVNFFDTDMTRKYFIMSNSVNGEWKNIPETPIFCHTTEFLNIAETLIGEWEVAMFQ